MDRTDLRIFSRLVGDALLTDERLARDVGLTGKAVRLRRKRMEAAGVLTEYGVHPSAEVLGRHSMTWRYAGKEWDPLPVARLLEVEDLAYVMSFRPGLQVVVRFTGEADPTPDPRLTRILGPPLEPVPDERPPESTVPAERLSRVDWRALEAAVGVPRTPLVAQARRANLSPRTFRIHRSQLEAEHVLQCVMLLNLEREAGLATYGVWLKTDDTFEAASLETTQLWDRPHWTSQPRGVYLLGSADNYFAAREEELRLRSLPGVVGADPLIPAGGFFARERMLGWIRAERERRFPISRRKGLYRPRPSRDAS
jgi:DNA-binding Lrp family transcriptional regulator